MPIGDILVRLDGTEPSDACLELAVDQAHRHGARVIGLYVADVLRTVELAIGAAGRANSATLAMLVDRTHEGILGDAAEIEARFRERLRRRGVEGEWRFVQDRPPGEAVASHARCADFAVLGQDDPHARRPLDRELPDWGPSVVERVLFSSGRPVLVVPYAGRFETVGRRVLVAWNASREAARALHDALPFVARAETVIVLTVDPRRRADGHGDVPAADIASHLARHGVRATVAREAVESLGEADALLDRAADMSADLIVAGAYGHPRLRELLLGGVTRALLDRMTVPVLMSH